MIEPEKQAEFKAYKKKWKKFFAPYLKELKSYKLLAQTLGGNADGYVEMWEFENLAELEKFFNKLVLSGYMTKLYPEFATLMVPASRTMDIWSSVP